MYEGQLTSAAVSFTELLSAPNEEPQFMLTCRSVGGPATTVQWTRDSSTITEDSSHSTSLVLVEPQQNTIYESRLTVTGWELGNYGCTITNNRGSFFGDAGGSVSSEAFTVSGEWWGRCVWLRTVFLSPTAAEEPTRLNAIDLLSDGMILATWTAPPGPRTGYVVYLEPGGVEESVSSDSTSHRFEGLQSGTDYLVSLVALSAQLPSEVVGPVAPSSESLFSLPFL